MLNITTEQDFKNHNDLPLARIKRIMKSDEDVRMISAEAPGNMILNLIFKQTFFFLTFFKFYSFICKGMRNVYFRTYSTFMELFREK